MTNKYYRVIFVYVLSKEFVTFGAYPEVVLEKSEEEKRNLLEELFFSYLAKDIEHEGVKNKSKFLALMRILCEQVGSLLNDKTAVKSINFWRTQEKQEVDFIINKKFAIETKFNAKSLKRNKYKKFMTNYKNIPLYLLSYKDYEDAMFSIYDVI